MKITSQKVHDRVVRGAHVITVEIGKEEKGATVLKMSEKRGVGLRLVALESRPRALLLALLLRRVRTTILKGKEDCSKIENIFLNLAGRGESRRNGMSAQTEIDAQIRMLDRLPNPDQGKFFYSYYVKHQKCIFFTN